MPKAAYPAWKAVQFDYDALALIDNSVEYQVCLTGQELALLKASLEPAYWLTRWKNYPGTSDDLAILIAGIDGKLNSIEECMGCSNCYIDIDNTWNTFNTNITQINTWNTAFVSGGGSFIVNILVSTAPRMGQGHDAETHHLYCYLAELWVKAIAESVLGSYSNPASDFFSKVGQYAGVIQSIFGKIAELPLPTYVTVAPWFASGAAGLAKNLADYISSSLSDELITALSDEDALNVIACCIADFLAGAADTRALSTWNNSILGAGNCSTSTENEEELRLFFRALLTADQTMYVMFYKMLDDASWLTAETSLPPCVCDGWCYNFDFTVSNGGWSTTIPNRPYGAYVASTGWQSVFPVYPPTPDTPTENDGVYIKLDNTDAYATQVVMDWNAAGSGSSYIVPVINLFYGGVRVAQAKRTITSSKYGDHTDTLTIPDGVLFDEINLIITSANAADTVTLTIVNLEVSGIGSNPYGANNC